MFLSHTSFIFRVGCGERQTRRDPTRHADLSYRTEESGKAVHRPLPLSRRQVCALSPAEEVFTESTPLPRDGLCAAAALVDPGVAIGMKSSRQEEVLVQKNEASLGHSDWGMEPE